MKNIRRLPRIKIDEHRNLSEPKESSKLIVTEFSDSNEYDVAKTEWRLNNVISVDSEGYSNVCDLCGNGSLKYNFILYNPYTNKQLSIGSTCIIRFRLISGNIDVESGVTIINNFIDEKNVLDTIRGLSKAVLIPSPEASDLKLFVESMKKYLESRGIKEPTVSQLGEATFGDRWIENSDDIRITSRLHALWYSPFMIPTVKIGKISKSPTIKEGTTWSKRSRSRVTGTSLGRSEVYNVEKYVTDNN